MKPCNTYDTRVIVVSAPGSRAGLVSWHYKTLGRNPARRASMNLHRTLFFRLLGMHCDLLLSGCLTSAARNMPAPVTLMTYVARQLAVDVLEFILELAAVR